MARDQNEPLEQVYFDRPLSPLTLNGRRIELSRRELFKYTAGATGAMLLGGAIPELATPARGQLAGFFAEIAVDVFANVVRWFLTTLIEKAIEEAIERSLNLKKGGPSPWDGGRDSDFHNQFKAGWSFMENLLGPTKTKDQYGHFVSIDRYYRSDVDREIEVNRDWNGVELNRVKKHMEGGKSIALPFGTRKEAGQKSLDLWQAYLAKDDETRRRLDEGGGKLTYVRLFNTPKSVTIDKQQTYLGCGVSFPKANGDLKSQLFLVAV